MKNAIFTTAAVALLMNAFSFTSANAQATATGHVSAEVIDAVGASVNNSSLVNPGSTITPATFSVNSTQNSTFAVTVESGATTLKSTDGAETMMVSDWTAKTAQGNVSVAAKLNEGDASRTGLYTGSYKVTFAYN